MKIKIPDIFSGSVMPFAGATAPAGYLLCDGSLVSRTTYAALFAAIGTVHGSGDGSTTFHLPDYRGRFLRGSDNMGSGAAARDPDRAARTASNSGGATGATVGSVQGSAYTNHTHVVQTKQEINSGGNAGISSGSAGGVWYSNLGTDNSTSGSTETRPQNANINYIIKF